ncbi:hypothetical protein V6N12_057381 [Hibiscus sabdariffa]|uniref:Transmembrane protein n=1 Tax=Hibiscus sabdariffa TaxID=183260 RepID=A0ABR2DBQ2_9ROSI
MESTNPSFLFTLKYEMLVRGRHNSTLTPFLSPPVAVAVAVAVCTLFWFGLLPFLSFPFLSFNKSKSRADRDIQHLFKVSPDSFQHVGVN